MICPNCGKPLHRDFCMHCGYMLNGNIIDTKKKVESSKLEKYLGNDFETVIHNTNTKTIFFLGPLYFSYRNYFVLGTILTFLDLYVIFKSRVIAQTFLNTYLLSFYLNFNIPVMIVTFLISRLFYIIMANEIYLKLLNRKIARGKKTILKENDCSKLNVFLSIILVIIFIIIYLIILFINTHYIRS